MSRIALATLVGIVLAIAVLIGGARTTYAQAAAPATTGVKISGEYSTSWRQMWLPTDVSKDGYQVDRLIHVLHWFMGALFVGWGVFFVYCLVRFRQRRGHKADAEPVKAKVSKFAEIGVAIFEAVLLIGFSVPVWAAARAEPPKPEDHPLRVRVIAEQFAWNFHYPGSDGVFGKTNPSLVNTATNPLGLDKSDPAATDDIASGELRLPVGRPIICEITSKDVIHSFFIPVMRVKQDAIPGMRIPVWFTAKEEAAGGVYEVACAQLCGNNHYSMRALMFLQSPNDFDAWLKEKSKPPEVFDE
ncbi:MAG: hypothetical protein AAB341_01220 [Planctomycetota bacterium]